VAAKTQLYEKCISVSIIQTLRPLRLSVKIELELYAGAYCRQYSCMMILNHCFESCYCKKLNFERFAL
jgi:hypothetical protein